MNIYLSSTVVFIGILIYLYTKVTLQLMQRQRTSLVEGSDQRRQSSTKRIKTVTFTAVALTLSYVCFSLPCLVCVSIRIWNPEFYMSLTTTGKIMFELFLKFYLLDSAVNPFIYFYCSNDFRKALSSYMTFYRRDTSKTRRSKDSTGNADILQQSVNLVVVDSRNLTSAITQTNDINNHESVTWQLMKAISLGWRL